MALVGGHDVNPSELQEVLSGRTEGITRIKLPKPKELRGKLDLETSATYKAPN